MATKKQMEEKIAYLQDELNKVIAHNIQHRSSLTFLAGAIAKANKSKAVYKCLKKLMWDFEDSADLASVHEAMDKLCIAEQRLRPKDNPNASG